ncbi:MAG: endo-1,4-beta-xylanase [Planctomycetota bacterium]
MATQPSADPVPGATIAIDGGTDAFIHRGPAVGPESLSRTNEEVNGERMAIVSLNVTEVTDQFWDAQLAAYTTKAVRTGDVLLASFWARCGSSMTGNARFQFDFERTSPPNEKCVSLGFAVGRQWRRFEIPFEVTMDTGAGDSRVAIQLGQTRQSLDMAGFSLRNFGPDIDIETLPKTELTYDGRASDAAWRAEADRRIREHRMADLTVSVRDEAGHPVEGAVVRVHQTRHGFPFGTAVAAGILTQPGPDGARYRRVVEELFNEVTFENELKWVNHGFGTGTQVEDSIAWLDERDIPIRGHVLVWPGWQWLPKPVKALEDRPVELRQIVEDRVRSAAGRYAGHLVDWDVLNEPFTNTDLMRILGDDVMVDWFRLAREADPDATLYINDFGILTTGARGNPQVEHYERTIRYLLDNGAPIDGVGMQGHFGGVLTAPDDVLAIIDRFAALGLDIKITELDINLPSSPVQAEYMRDVLTALFSHPAVDGIIVWGFWSERHWLPDAAFFDAEWNMRPVGLAWYEQVHRAWWTNAEVVTGSDGAVTVRAFHGDHTVTVDGSPAKDVMLDADGLTVVITAAGDQGG